MSLFSALKRFGRLGAITLKSLFNPASLSTLAQWLKTAPVGDELEDSSRTGTARDVQPGRAYLFDGINDYVDLNSTIALTGEFTVTFWAKRNATTAFDYVVAAASPATNRIGFTNNTTAFYARIINGGSVDITTTHGVDTTEWNHYTLTRNSDNKIDLYVNAANKQRMFSDAAQSGTSNIDTLGFDGGTSTHSGNMFDVRIYNTELTQDEVEYIYTFGTSGTNPGTANLQGHYKCDENDIITSFDSSGNGNDGIKTNVTLSTFAYENSDVPFSYQNEVGFTDSSGTLIPRDESDTANDVQGNPLQYSGKAPHDAALINSNCATFDGVDDFVSLLPSNTFTNTSCSFSFWVSPAAFAGATLSHRIFSVYRSTGSSALIFGVTASGFELFVNDGVASTTVTASTSTLKFYHITVVSNGSDTKLYIDGVLQATNARVPAAFSVDDITIGALSNGTSAYDGVIFDVRGYSDVLTVDEVEYIYTFGKSGTDPTDTNLIGYWPLAEGAGTTVYDVSGNDNHGTITNATLSSFWGTTQDVFHYNATEGFDGFLEFDGTDSIVTLASDIDQAGDFTISWWMNPSGDLISKTIIGDQSNDYVRIGTAASLTIRIAAVTYFMTGLTYATLNQLDHAALVRSGSTLTYYLNGVELDSTTASTNTLRLDRIGAYNTFGVWQGLLADVRVYDTALTANEITYVYSGGTSGTDPGTANLVGKWLLNDCRGTTAADSSGNGNDGTLTGFDAPFWGRLPAASDSNSILGGTSSNPAIAVHNNAETQIDFTGGVAAPWTTKVYRGYATVTSASSQINFANLTGITVSSYTFQNTDPSPSVSGNNIVFGSDGDVRTITLSNGAVIDLTKGRSLDTSGNNFHPTGLTSVTQSKYTVPTTYSFGDAFSPSGQTNHYKKEISAQQENNFVLFETGLDTTNDATMTNQGYTN